VRTVRGSKIAPGSSKKTAGTKKEVKEDRSRDGGQKTPSNLGETLFGAKTLGSSNPVNPFSTSSSSSGNPFATSSNPFSTAKPEPPGPLEASSQKKEEGKASQEGTEEKSLSKTFADTLSLNNPQESEPKAAPAPEPWPSDKELPQAYPVSYLADADYETLDPTPPPVSQATTQMDIDDGLGGSGGSGGVKEDRDVFESSMDADFQKFADRLAQNPEQVIRYEYAGQPLLYSKTDAVGQTFTTKGGMPRCGNCGSARVFEVQLTPEAITELEKDEMSLDGMDWGTIIVGVCGADCQPRGTEEGAAAYIEEWAGVQWEEMSARR
jgi:pre-rRNA-processing protein TSR4